MFALGELLGSMSGAHTITRLYEPFPGKYPITDSEIIFANEAAAAVYGRGTAQELIGTLLGDTQPVDVRDEGRFAWWLREKGLEIPLSYYTMIQRPDSDGAPGELVLARKEVVEVPMKSNMNGDTMWWTRLELMQYASQELPDLRQFGLSYEDFHKEVGWTPRQLREDQVLLDDLDPTDNVRRVLLDYPHLLSSAHGKLFEWARSTDRIRQLYTCEDPDCRGSWFGTLGLDAPQCSQCRGQPGRIWKNPC